MAQLCGKVNSSEVSPIDDPFVSVYFPASPQECFTSNGDAYKEIFVGRRKNINQEVSFGKLENGRSPKTTWWLGNKRPGVKKPGNERKNGIGIRLRIRINGGIR